MNLVPNKQLLLNVPFQSTKYRKKKNCVWTTKYKKTIGEVFCPTCRIKKCVCFSTNKKISFYDCEKCKACCHVLNVPSKDQKPTNMLFSGDGTQSFARKTSRDFEKERLSQLLKAFLGQWQPSTSELEPKKAEVVPFRAFSCPHPIG